jgi:hypothetical protein
MLRWLNALQGVGPFSRAFLHQIHGLTRFGIAHENKEMHGILDKAPDKFPDSKKFA